MSSLAQNNVKPSLKDRLIPWYFVLMFLVVFAVNGVFVYVAVNSNSGVVTENAYEKGLSYDETLNLAKQQTDLGWQIDTEYNNGVIKAQVQDAQGQPITGATVKAYFQRPVESGYDFSLKLDDAGDGLYQHRVDAPLKGQWNVTIGAVWDKKFYQTKKRLVVK